MNLALLNEHLFPAMKQYETKAATQFAIDQRDQLRAERKPEMLDAFSGYAANNQMGVGFEKLLDYTNMTLVAKVRPVMLYLNMLKKV